MNIVILGAGAMGSLFGGLLSKKNNVSLIGRKIHVQAIKENGLKITGKTQLNVRISAEDSIGKIGFSLDLLILTVKSYDTETAIKEAKTIIGDNTVVLSLQNGLDNIEKICKIMDKKNVVVGVTTHGVFFSKPGLIKHTGSGETILGELDGKKTERIKHIADLFNEAGIETTISTNIVREIWIKAIVNSSINPLTTFFQCKNGYLLENPVLENLVERICKESTDVANNEGIQLSHQDMIKKTKEVIRNTSENYSSMFQSFKKGGKTEIDSINGKIVDLGKINGVKTPINEAFVRSIKSICRGCV
ncbi:MAG: 2-dehydropantoate 2-reductase [Euryarchaeota archaeon]|nr:2-dehydropantoate 2-reductase [Euryarchaeota archaeon]